MDTGKRVGENGSTSALMRAGGMAVFPVGTEPRMMKIRIMSEWDHLDIWGVVCNYLISPVVTRAFILSQLPEAVNYSKASQWNSVNSTLNRVDPQHCQNCKYNIFSSVVQTASHFGIWHLWNGFPKAKLISRRRPSFIICFGFLWQAANCGSRNRRSLKETG